MSLLAKTNFIYRKSLTDNIFNAIIVLQDKERGEEMSTILIIFIVGIILGWYTERFKGDKNEQ